MIWRVVVLRNGRPVAISGDFSILSAAEQYMRMAIAQGYKDAHIQQGVPKGKRK